MKWKDSFLDYLRVERNYSPKTIIAYGRDVDDFEAWLSKMDSSLSLLAADRDLVRGFVAAEMDKNFTPATVNRKLCALRTLYRYLQRMGVLSENPALHVAGPKKRKTLPAFLKENEMDRLLDELEQGDGFVPVRNKTILQLFYEAGLRLSELTSLTNAAVDLPARSLKVTGKRNKQRIIPFGESLAAQLALHAQERARLFPLSGQPGSPLFLSDKGRPLTNSQVYYMVHNHLSMVSTQKKRSPHVLRHTFATALLNHRAQLSAVKELLGHQSLATTQIYTHTTLGELKSVYNEAHPRARNNKQ